MGHSADPYENNNANVIYSILRVDMNMYDHRMQL